jgi:hypothetical protein
MRKINFNTLPIGLLLGLFLPMVMFMAFYGVKFSHLEFMEFVQLMIDRDIIIQIISLCVIVNLLTFFLFIQTHRYYSARGVIMATFIYAIVVVIFKMN